MEKNAQNDWKQNKNCIENGKENTVYIFFGKNYPKTYGEGK